MNPRDDKRDPLELKSGQSAVKNFFNEKDDEKIKNLKSRYQTSATQKQTLLERLKHKIMPSLSNINYDPSKMEKLIDFQQKRGREQTWRELLQQSVDDRLYVKYKGRMVYFWQTKMFKEAAFLHFPRIMFLAFTCYVITRIRINNDKLTKNKS